jgi:hypothetical protein
MVATLRAELTAGTKRLLALRGPALKAIIFGAAWYFFPTWLFIGVALVLYFVPFFQTSVFFSLFVGLLAVAAWAPAGFWYAVFLAVLFGWLLSIKDLMFIDRRLSCEMLIFAVAFFLLRQFYVSFGTLDGSALLGAFFVAAIIGWMVRTLVLRFGGSDGPEKWIAFRLVGILAWQAIVICLFFPLDATYQSIVAFLLIVPTVDVLADYVARGFSREKIFVASGFAFSLLALVLVSAVWKP